MPSSIPVLSPDETTPSKLKTPDFSNKENEKKRKFHLWFRSCSFKKKEKIRRKKRRRKENFVSKFKFDFSFKYFQSALKDLSFCFVLPR